MKTIEEMANVIAVLKDHNKWRRAEGEYAEIGVKQKYSPKEIGDAIDLAIEILEMK